MPIVDAVRRGTLNRPSSLVAMLRDDFYGQPHRLRMKEVALDPMDGSPGVRSGWYEFENKVLGWSIVEIDPGATGPMHRQLCESTMFVLQGSGYTLLNGDKIEWRAGDVLFVPLFAWHQHVNMGNEVVRYLRMSTAPLYYYLGIYRKEDVPPPDSWERAKAETGAHGRVIIRREEWLERKDWKQSGESQNVEFDFDYRVPTSRDVPSRLNPHQIGGMHRHASEAQIYIFQGTGFATLNDAYVDLEPGDVLRVPIFSWHQLTSASDEHFIYLKNNSAGIYNRLSILMRDVKKDFKDLDVSQLKDDFNIY